MQFVVALNNFFTQYKHTYGQLRASHCSHMKDAHTVLYLKKHTQTYASYPAMDTAADLGGGGLWGLKPPSPRLPPFAENFMSSLSPTFILSVHARFSMSDSFVDLPQVVVN